MKQMGENMTKYTEIFKLKAMLENAKIPFEFADRTMFGIKYTEKYQIGYPVIPPDDRCICSAIEGCGTYGQYENLIEIFGLLTKEEEMQDEVAGYLTAEDVFKRIKNDYDSKKETEETL